ncbi:cobalt transporter CbiM [Campylobacter sp. MIT 12-5580]|uniref:cobalt transporter CbiM n=1 Tax=Campylobacter sp. MIT 12-5580 TaxID=2040651 RepID=UPI0010F72713|nr:cobalt transporter CbiM [Campylobacter sp. MIT 12-5580]TKX29656.1 cobalt transporter CbiM [Campylobacter sp. MIT 12-5580]
MHISEGVLKPEILISAGCVSAALLTYTLYKLKQEQIPKIACMSALFFIGSFIHIPIGPTSIHLILSGFIGAFLGFNAFLAIFVALLLQALFFGFGGLSVLGVNVLMMALPALIARVFLASSFKQLRLMYYFLIGFMPIFISSLLLSLVLILNGNEFMHISIAVFLANIPLMVVEGLIALFAFSFIYKTNKELLR